MPYTSKYIFEIPEINDIIMDYVDDLYLTNETKKKFDKTIAKLNEIKHINDTYDFHRWAFHCSSCFITKVNSRRFDIIEAEVCMTCGNYFPYTLDVEHSSTIRQFCSCLFRP